LTGGLHAQRYYGKSLPFGDKSLEPDNAVYLTTEQILADYAVLVTHLKATLPGAANCPVVAFGGSYGGTLTTYFRHKVEWFGQGSSSR
jgi:lysosomal Pro-X carboxypeptidase